MDQHTGQQPVPPQGGYGQSPFEEPDAAPELREERSENLYSRDEPFWNRVVDMPRAGEKTPRDPNYWNHPDVMDTDRFMVVDNDTAMDKLRKFLGSGAVKKFLLIVCVLAAVAFVLYSALFQVRAITVTGNSTISAEEIIRLSGLQVGQSSMTIDDESVMRRVENNRYLRCTLVDVKWDSVVIHVKERVPVAYFQHNGMLVTIDNRGFVLEETTDTHADMGSLILVTGMSVKRCALGQQVSLTTAAHLDVYTQILVELKAMQGLDLLKELDMSGMDNIFLTTHDGFTVRIGNEESIHEKLRAFLITRTRLLEMGYGDDGDAATASGSIDVTDPGRPTFQPPQ